MAEAREAAASARAELDRVRRAAEEQVVQVRQDAERDQAGLRAGLEAQIAAAEEARAGLQARAEQAEADRWQARQAARQAEAQLAEAREAQAAAEQQARTAREQLAAARQEPDDVVTGAQSRTAGAESRAGQAGQDAAEPDRADDAQAEQQRPGADRDEAAGQPARRQPKSTTRRSRQPRRK